MLFIENRWVQSCDSRFTREADATSLIPIDFSISTKEATRPNSNFAKLSRRPIVDSRYARTHWWERDRA